MTAAYIGGPPPTEGIISVTLGCGRRFSVQSIDDDADPVSWTEEVYLVVDLNPPVTIDADVVDSLATISIGADVCDVVTPRTAWQLILGTTPPTPLLIGKFERNDK